MTLDDQLQIVNDWLKKTFPNTNLKAEFKDSVADTMKKAQDTVNKDKIFSPTWSYEADFTIADLELWAYEALTHSRQWGERFKNAFSNW